MSDAITLRTPTYRKHKGSGQAVVTLNGKDHYLGCFGTEGSKANYDRLISAWLSNGRQLPATGPEVDANRSINEVILAFWKYAEKHYCSVTA